LSEKKYIKKKTMGLDGWKNTNRKNEIAKIFYYKICIPKINVTILNFVINKK